MDKRVYLLTIVSFVVGMVELIIGGILDLVAASLEVSVGQAGLLITVFSLVFAIASPILLFLTARIERKKLTLITLFIFFLSNVLAVLSPVYSVLFISRIISAASASLLIVLCVTMASTIVEPQYRGRAIGIVNMGVSGSLVLGIPFGLMLGNTFGWRAPFIMIAILTLCSMAGVYFFMKQITPGQGAVSIGQQLRTLKNSKILLANATTFLVLAGHTTLYTYLTPFAQVTMGLEGLWISIVYLVFGVAAVSGGAIGGSFADYFGTKRTILSVIIIFIIAIFAVPFSTFFVPFFFFVMVVWGSMSWAITPPMQSYLMELSPKNSDILISLNNSSLHLGIAVGSFAGSIVVDRVSIEYNAIVGGIIIVFGLVTALLATRRGTATSQ
ncbi:MFS transporter [Oceanobacillus profundus]|uniref:MFS transporter n=1 Tax=Oceanobacillus profundus TaxID=372463 RepID=A0A417YHZ4_9BACI|nr:MFS transporter [Oceanobacillus profundus]MBR3118048.1 MFS transporter [Oceanobacillus sp.]PAE28413.1 MFS transporter [Paenibacillus sp. 7884-2]MCM3398902.1 MFS transporter [Oceanobacillus profundus]MDO6451650.1 MFS transporter [Oceanobacillus profundus]RHW32505.1 MFS transporter [Oceanobacillus profundus]